MSEFNGAFRRSEQRPQWPRVHGEIGIKHPSDNAQAVRFLTKPAITMQEVVHGPPFLRALYTQLLAQLRETLVTMHEIAVSGTVTIRTHYYAVEYAGQVTVFTKEAYWRFGEKMHRAVDIATLLALLPTDTPSELILTTECAIEA
ncbi:MAG: hypothetical protein G01um1014106_528 [Parcubacteria group bacterium Gr01-1014_106]|nr:MAG: hypothetical protein G01um1014106_528 [Parcubacteria group bacterium Gr01-1014_106]